MALAEHYETINKSEDRPETPVESALSDAEAHRGELEEILVTLAHRLESSLTIKYGNQTKGDDTSTRESAGSSVLVGRIERHTNRLIELKDIAGHILRNLEV